MKTVILPLGESDFKEIREQNLFFIDKTSLICDLLAQKGTKVFLFTRPRRFGKSLALSMLSSFFDITKDSGKLFEGLEISEDRELCKKWMNKYPTILVSFKDVGGLTFESAYERLCSIISNLFYNFSLRKTQK